MTSEGGRNSGGGGRFAAKKLWRSRAKSQSRITALTACSWIPEGDCRWRLSDGGGCRLTLTNTTLVCLSKTESAVLSQLALERLHAYNLPVRIEKPKEEPETPQKTKRRPALLRKKAITTSFFEAKKDVDSPSSMRVFGVPLQLCIDKDLRQFANAAINTQPRVDIPLQYQPVYTKIINDEDISRSDNSDRSSLSSLIELPSDRILQRRDTDVGLNASDRTHSSIDLSAASTKSSLSLSGLQVCGPQVPRVVNCCLEYLEKFGLNTIGVFRVSSSKRRVRQLREAFDCGQEVYLDDGDEHQAHDVAQLLKEYFRDLPQPLLTRDLYSAFLYTQRIVDRQKQLDILRLLIRLLPPANRDTLWALLRLLVKVSEYAVDRRTPQGLLITGNKMDAHNLATMLGPNILRYSTKSGGDSMSVKFSVEKMERAEERSDVILVCRQLVEDFHKLFFVSAEEIDAIYRRMLVERPEELDLLLRRRFYSCHEVQDDVFEEDIERQTVERSGRTMTREFHEITSNVIYSSNQKRSSESNVPYILVTGDMDIANGSDQIPSIMGTNQSRAPSAESMRAPSAESMRAPSLDSRAPSADSASRSMESRAPSTDSGDTTPERKSRPSRKLVSTKEKQEKTFKLQKSRSASSLIGNFLFGHTVTRRDSNSSGCGDEENIAAPPPRRPSRISFRDEKPEKWKRCDLISSEHNVRR